MISRTMVRKTVELLQKVSERCRKGALSYFGSFTAETEFPI